MNEMRLAIAKMEKARDALDAPAAAPVVEAEEPALDTLTALRRWRVAAGVRFVGKSLHVKARK